MLSLVFVVTISILLASMISMVLMFKLMENQKVVKWFVNYYAKSINKMAKAFEEAFEDLDVE